MNFSVRCVAGNRLGRDHHVVSVGTIHILGFERAQTGIPHRSASETDLHVIASALPGSAAQGRHDSRGPDVAGNKVVNDPRGRIFGTVLVPLKPSSPKQACRYLLR